MTVVVGGMSCEGLQTGLISSHGLSQLYTCQLTQHQTVISVTEFITNSKDKFSTPIVALNTTDLTRNFITDLYSWIYAAHNTDKHFVCLSVHPLSYQVSKSASKAQLT